MSDFTVILADDHALFRAGIRSLLESFPGVRVVAETETGRDLVRLAQELKPSLAVVDITMPELNGLDALLQLKQVAPTMRIIMLTMHMSEEYVMRALRAGADGYMLKTAAAPELETAIRSVVRGDNFLSPAVSKNVIDACLGRSTLQPRTKQLITPRQREILQLIAEGKTSKEIAIKLGLSFKTVETHRAQLMERLDIHDIAGLVRCAMRLGLISAES
jgi:DNA-binding NarL/FixJ family response regulator